MHPGDGNSLFDNFQCDNFFDCLDVEFCCLPDYVHELLLTLCNGSGCSFLKFGEGFRVGNPVGARELELEVEGSRSQCT